MHGFTEVLNQSSRQWTGFESRSRFQEMFAPVIADCKLNGTNFPRVVLKRIDEDLVSLKIGTHTICSY